MADSYIAGRYSKIQCNLWRPVTAIAAADHDGNPATSPIPRWLPYLPAPPIQYHPSTHATLGAAAATVLEKLLDVKAFAMTSTAALAEVPWQLQELQPRSKGECRIVYLRRYSLPLCHRGRAETGAKHRQVCVGHASNRNRVNWDLAGRPTCQPRASRRCRGGSMLAHRG
jgi:hypothetical protein